MKASDAEHGQATSASRMDEDAAPAARLPRIRLRLRTVLVVVSLLILTLPLIGIYALRLHEATLVEQTEVDLRTNAAYLAAAFGALLGRRVDSIAALPALDLHSAPIQPPLPSGKPGPIAGDDARRVGERMAPMLTSTQTAYNASKRLLDTQGVVVATTEGDLGLSMAHVPSVQRALGGIAASSLHQESSVAPVLGGVVRGVDVRVFLAMPIMADDEVLGVVVLSRPPSNILDTLLEKRDLLLQGALLLFLVVALVGFVTARGLVWPIRSLAVSAGRVSRGETDTFEQARHFRVREIADLAASIEAMVASLQHRASYVRNLARHINHEFKTPIAAAKGALELLQDQFSTMTEAEARRFIDNMAGDVSRLERLTTRLLELAQVNMAPPVNESADVLAVARALGEPSLRVAEGSAQARISEDAARALLLHLVDNALRYGAEQVEVCAAPGERPARDARRGTGATVEVAVRDDGPGISAGNRSRVFDPFFTTSKEEGGTGLGLAICRALVDACGGSIELAPCAHGTAFKITLPAAEGSLMRGGGSQASRSPSRTPAEGSPMRGARPSRTPAEGSPMRGGNPPAHSG